MNEQDKSHLDSLLNKFEQMFAKTTEETGHSGWIGASERNAPQVRPFSRRQFNLFVPFIPTDPLGIPPIDPLCHFSHSLTVA